ncbi:Calcipressin [Radiomyces spectabilis]|uniref:Calcipressin n=1 Tax=Radiomyces spectabilis TaxID=64574 RepID=UPI00222063CD|nr:Calcipressin [Radiomyces spectabilis]KAI8376119.1 Calcipressin [Radiomyces spectabilis]
MATMPHAESIATNTLLIPDIPKEVFQSPEAICEIRELCATFGDLHQFIAMKSFRRFMVIYEDTLSSMRAKNALDRSWVTWTDNTCGVLEPLEIRVYYGQHSPLHSDPALNQLQVPNMNRNFLISPPGSPFDDWQQIEEDPPNQNVLASDLIHAVASTEDDDDLDDDFCLDDNLVRSPTSTTASTTAAPVLQIVCSEGDPLNENLPMITVQDWDGQDTTKLTDSPNRCRPHVAPTARPPLQA